MPTIRLDKYISDLGLGSRKEIRDWIRSGRVSVDGRVIRQSDEKLDPASAAVCLDGEALRYRKAVYLMMNKPEGVITATEDENQKTVLDLLPKTLRSRGLFPVGRLDKDTSGLLILTDDGDYAHRVSAPKSGVVKRYLAEVDGEPDEEDAAAFQSGLVLADGTLEILGDRRCIVSVSEGKYHQVKRMLASRGKPVKALKRLSIGALDLDESLAPGEFRELSEQELCTVFMVR